jgi:hypothetical protein
MLKTTKVLMIAFAFFAGCMDSGPAAIKLATSLTIDFKNATDAQAKATWSPADRIGITVNGLGWNVKHTDWVCPWVETKPVALGLSWRAAASTDVTVKVHLLPRDIDKENPCPYVGAVFARYSPDAKNWSSWQALQQQEKAKTSDPQQGIIFKGEVGVPQRERKEYGNLLSEYSTLDVPWNCDEEAAVKWILAKDPDFFKKHVPFVGYVEFLFEFPFYDEGRLTKFEAEMGVGLGGVHTIPKDPNALKDRGMDVPWRYKAN